MSSVMSSRRVVAAAVGAMEGGVQNVMCARASRVGSTVWRGVPTTGLLAGEPTRSKSLARKQAEGLRNTAADQRDVA